MMLLAACLKYRLLAFLCFFIYLEFTYPNYVQALSDNLNFREFFIYDPKLAYGNPNFYAYAPSIIQIDSQYFVHSCHNRIPKQVKDHIIGFKYDDSAKAVTVGQIVALAPSETANVWDAMHVCDPSVVRGNFRFGGISYKYAMFYTGAPFNISKFNQIGVAFSQSLESTNWTRYPYPLIRHPDIPMIENSSYIDISKIHDYRDPRYPFGIAQPTATAVSDGTVLLAYTVGDRNGTRAEVRHVNLSNVDETPQISASILLPTSGLTDPIKVVLNNFDMAYDSISDTIYIVRDSYPQFGGTNPDFLSRSVEIASIPGAVMWTNTNNSYSWKSEGLLDAVQFSNAKRIHNAGLVRNEWGGLMRPVQVMVSDAKESDDFYEWLFSYRMRLVELI